MEIEEHQVEDSILIHVMYCNIDHNNNTLGLKGLHLRLKQQRIPVERKKKTEFITSNRNNMKKTSTEKHWFKETKLTRICKSNM